MDIIKEDLCPEFLSRDARLLADGRFLCRLRLQHLGRRLAIS